MSNDAGGFGQPGPPPPGYPLPAHGQPAVPVPPPGYPGYPQPGYYPAPDGYPPPGYQGYPPPGYAPQAYPPPGYAPQGYPPPGYAPPGYQGYPPPGYAPPGYPPPGYAQPPEIKPGVIPLRPLSLSEIYNGAVAYIRMNPKVTLGLTAAVVVAAQILTLILQVGPIAAAGGLRPAFEAGDEVSRSAVIASSLSSVVGAVTTWLSAIVLSGLLTVVVGRAVFGAGITIGQAWQRVRGRLLALFVVTAIEAIGVVILVGIGVGIVLGVGYGTDSFGFAFVVGLLLTLLLGSLLVYLWTMLSFAPPLIVLERLGLVPAIKRSFALVKNDFWRVLGIRLLGLLAAGMIAGAVSIPFSLGGQVALTGAHSTSTAIVGLVLISVGGAIGQIITAPFTAGVVVLQYADRRMRAEAFDLVLRSGVGAQPDRMNDSTDHLWLTPHP